MSDTTQQMPITLYTESTPNPDTLKFVTNKMLLPSGSVDYRTKESAQYSPLALSLFNGFEYVNGIFIAANFITITKTKTTQWHEVMVEMKEYIKNYISEGNVIVDRIEEKEEKEVLEGDEAIVDKIKELLETYVRPAVEMDGGAISFSSYKEGIVTVVLQGACSGCPSSTVTLKSGIEGMLKRMIPEVKEVVAEMG